MERLRRAEGRRPRGCERSIVCGRGAIDGHTHTHTQREPLETEKKEEEDDRRREEKTWLSRELNEVSKIK